MSRRPVLAALLAALLLVGACSSGDDEQPQVVDGDGGGSMLENPEAGEDPIAPPETVVGLPDPCLLVPTAEVATVTGEDVVSSTLSPLTSTSAVCDHVVDDAGSVGTAIGITTEEGEADLDLHTSVEDATAVGG
ncbi:hypothetical protein B7486_51845, partial [cyanobacterium TDX16]